jgi:PTS system mannose-specific IIA component
MIGILLISHADLAQGLLNAASLIVGEMPQCEAVGLFPGMEFDSFVQDVATTIEKGKSDDGTLVLVDLFGGTPGNAAALAKKHVQKDTKYAVVSGANLPMLLEAYTSRETMTLGELKDYMIEVCAASARDVLVALGVDKLS